MRLWPRNSRHPILWLLLYWVVATCLGLFLFLQWCEHTYAGRRLAKYGLERLVSDNIPGAMQITSLDEFSLSRVVAREVRFYHTDGRCLILAKHAVVIPDWGLAMKGMLGFKSADIDGGYFVLSMDPNDKISVENTMNGPTPPGKPNDPYGGVFYELRAMHVQHLTVYLKLSKQFEYRIEDVEGFVGVNRVDTPGVQVVLNSMNGRIEPEIAGSKVSLRDVSGWIHGKAKEVIRMQAKLGVGSGILDTHVGYWDREKDKLTIRVDKSKGVEAVAMAWLIRALAGFTSDVKVDG